MQLTNLTRNLTNLITLKANYIFLNTQLTYLATLKGNYIFLNMQLR